MPVRTFLIAQCLAFLATLVGVGRVRAQDAPGIAIGTVPPRIGRILGVFDEGGRPLDGVEVVDRIGGGTMRTMQSGLVSMGVLASQHDSAVVTIRKIGFADTTILVMVGARDTVPMQVFLRRATALEQVTITAHETEHLPFYLKDFEERLKDARWSGAKTFTPAELRRRDGTRLYDLLVEKHAAVPTPRCGRAIVYLDGIPWTPPETEPGSMGVPKEDVDNFDAAVFYSLAQMPSEIFRTIAPIEGLKNAAKGEICAALMLYSRHRI
jgi:hypothetical protein